MLRGISSDNKKYIVAEGIVLAAITALVAIYSPLNPLTGTGMTADQGVFFAVAKGLTEGKLAYVDYFDHKGPWLYIILALGLEINKLIAGSISATFIGNFLIELVTIFLSVLFMYKIARLFANRPISMLAVLVVFMCNIRLYTASNSEEYIFPLICISAYLFLKQLQEGIDNRYAFVMGACGMLTFFVKFNYCILWAVMGIVMFAVMVANYVKSRRANIISNAGARTHGCSIADIVKMCLAFAGGMLVVTIIFGVYLIATGSLKDFIDTYIIFSLDYASMATFSKRIRTGLALLDVPIEWILVAYAAITLTMTIVYFSKARNVKAGLVTEEAVSADGLAEDRSRLGLHLAWLLLSVAMFVTVASPGQPWTYYQQAAMFIYIGAVAAFGSWLVGICRFFITNIKHEITDEQTDRSAGIIGAIVLAVLLVVSLRSQLAPSNLAITADERQQSILNVSAEIMENYEEGDTLISFADDCGMYFYTDCEPASRIIFPSASIIAPALADELIEDLEESPAKFMTFTDGWTFGIPEKLTDWVDATLSEDYELIYDDGLRTIYMAR